MTTKKAFKLEKLNSL